MLLRKTLFGQDLTANFSNSNFRFKCATINSWRRELASMNYICPSRRISIRRITTTASPESSISSSSDTHNSPTAKGSMNSQRLYSTHSLIKIANIFEELRKAMPTSASKLLFSSC